MPLSGTYPAPDSPFATGDGGAVDVYLRPVAFVTQVEDDPGAWPLTGGPRGFSAVEVLRRAGEGVEREVVPVALLDDWLQEKPGNERVALLEKFAALETGRESFAGLDLDRPRLMGIVNVTPDSFSDGGLAFEPASAIAHGRTLLAAGADILDVGGESTRPGAAPVDEAEEVRRVLPVVQALAEDGAVVSVDTRRAAVARAACAAGAHIVNDVTALGGDPEAIAAVAEAGASVVLMHMQGEPRTMQHDPQYRFAPCDVFDFLAGRIEACEEAGIPRHRIAVDPGIGFGKTPAHNLQLLSHLSMLHGLGCPVLLGASRKSFISLVAGKAGPGERLAGTLAANQAALEQGVQILRVHDVAEARQAVSIWSAIARSSLPHDC